MAFAIGSLAWATAKGAEQKPPLSRNPSLTVAEAIGVGAALRRLTYYTVLMKDKDGKEAPANLSYGPDRPSPYKFDGDVLFAISVNIQQADLAQRTLQESMTALIKQVYGASDKVPKPGEPDSKGSEFSEQAAKIMAAQSGVLMAWIKKSDLCLSAKPPKCEAANPIPADVLSGMLPVIDRE